MSTSTRDKYIGKHLLFGITFREHNGKLIDQIELHGTIISIDQAVIRIQLANSDEEFTLPSDVESMSEAAPGEYRLRSTGEVVVNPDLLATWTVTRPALTEAKAPAAGTRKPKSKPRTTPVRKPKKKALARKPRAAKRANKATKKGKGTKSR